MSYKRTEKFRPQGFSMAFRLHTKFRVGIYNWQPRFDWTIKKYLIHVFSVLHYRGSHAPEPIQQKWRRAAKRFEQQHRKIL